MKQCLLHTLYIQLQTKVQTKNKIQNIVWQFYEIDAYILIFYRCTNVVWSKGTYYLEKGRKLGYKFLTHLKQILPV